MQTRVAFTTYGDPDAPAILFLHGIRLGAAIWQLHATALASRYRIVAVDLPGHGALAGMPFTTENVTALLDEAIDGIASGPPVIVGYSLGGYVAMRYAAHYPQRTAGLLLAGCTLDFEGWKWWPYGLGVRFTQMLPESIASRLVHTTLYMTLPQYWLEVVEGIPFDRDVFARTSEIVRTSANALDEIGSYRKPVLFVNGEYDLAFRTDERRFLHRLPQARLRIIGGVDHTGPLRRVETFTQIVDEFVSQVLLA